MSKRRLVSSPPVFLLAAGLALSAGACAAPPDAAGDEDPGTLDESVSSAPFIRSDQVSFGRAPHNTGDLSKEISTDFTDPKKDAAHVIAWLKDHPSYEHPLYLGC